MIDKLPKNQCTGCNAWVDVCPCNAIILKTEKDGFWYPQIDSEKCIQCDLCERRCPVLNFSKLRSQQSFKPICYAAINKDIETRFDSTSGGIFSALAEYMYSRKGYVGGAIYMSDFSVKHFISDDKVDLAKLRQSKYSQSQTIGIFRETKDLLDKGKEVLICGTPCQMAGLRTYLNRDYENLVIVDFICKSITSPRFFDLYLNYYRQKHQSEIVHFKFKDKGLGWRSLVKRLDFANGETEYSRMQDGDLYSRAYHANLVSRPSCYNCKFKGYPRYADITIADFWGVERYHRELDDNAGTSAVIINTKRGEKYFESIKELLVLRSTQLTYIERNNPALIKKQAMPKCNRDTFFEGLDETNFEQRIIQYTPRKKYTLREQGIYVLQLLRMVLSSSQCRPKPLWQFIKYNFLRKKTYTNWRSFGFLFPTPHVAIDITPDAVLTLNGPLLIGVKTNQASKMETRLLVRGELKVKDRFSIGYGSDIEVFSGAYLEIGDCGTNCNCSIICGKKIVFDGRVSLGRDVNIRDTNAHHIVIDGYKVLRPVYIGNHIWICSGCEIMPGSKVKDGCVISAKSVVYSTIPPHSLASGNPAKVVMKDVKWYL